MAIVDQGNELVVLGSVLRTPATYDSTVQASAGSLGCRVVVSCTAITGTLDVKVMGVDPVSGNVFDLQGQAATAAITQIVGAGTYEMTLLPGTVETAGRRHSTALPTQFIVRSVVGGTNATYSVVVEKIA